LFAIALTALALVAACSEKSEPPRQAAAPVVDEMTLLLEAVRKNPRDTDSWMHIADLYERAQAFEQEADALQKVLAVEPGRGFAHLKLANTYNQLGRREEAIASFLQAKKYLPNNPMLYNNLGWTYGQVGKTKEQLQALRQAVSLRPRFATARLNLGLVLLKQGDRKGAQQQYEALQEFDEGAAAALKKEIEGGKR
jgi:tetratricopeptide (TPR) repeat protein